MQDGRAILATKKYNKLVCRVKNKNGAMLYRGKYFIVRGEIMPRIVKNDMTMPFFHLMTQEINKEYIFENNKDKAVYEN